jgi:hypothetical protein
MSLVETIRDNEFAGKMRYFDSVRTVNELDSVWSIYEIEDVNDIVPLDAGLKRITYEYIRNDATSEDLMLDLKDGGKRGAAMVSAFVAGDTWLDWWKAAESCIRQSGTHHRYIEDFVLQEDGSYELVTGS